MQYPNNIKKNSQFTISHSNRGMDLENMINETNEYYLNNDIAVIYKKPTPIGTVKVAYENGHKVINKAYFQAQSTLDYNGLYKGYYIDFDAKSTTNKTSFPLSNIHHHQIEHIKKVIKHGGISFLIISINGLIYLLDGTVFLEFINSNERKSIPYEYIKENAHLININLKIRLDYLSIVDKVYINKLEESR